MTTNFTLPSIGSRTSSPMIERILTSEYSVATPSSLPQLPSLNSSSSIRVGKISRLPLSNIEVYNHDGNKPSEMEVDSINTYQKSVTDVSDRNVTVKSKMMELHYPDKPKIPSRSLVQALYNEAISTTNESSNENCDQMYLCDAGLLSFEQVMLPAVAYQEEQMLKEWQAIVQRDGSQDQKAIVVKLRKAVYNGIGAACAAVKQSRLNRAVHDVEREKEWQLVQKQKMEHEEEIRQQQQQIVELKYQEGLRQRQRDLQKKLPANQEVWREVAYLMTELTKLSNEERQWQIVSSQYLDRTEAELHEQEKIWEAAQENLTQMDDETNTFDVASETVQEIVGHITETAADISLAVDRIRLTLSQVSHTVSVGEQSRQRLYQQYVTNHQFYGYQGVHDPKGLLKVLSQSQSED